MVLNCSVVSSSLHPRGLHIARQAPLSCLQARMLELPFPSPRERPFPGIEPASPALAGGFFTARATSGALYHMTAHQGAQGDFFWLFAFLWSGCHMHDKVKEGTPRFLSFHSSSPGHTASTHHRQSFLCVLSEIFCAFINIHIYILFSSHINVNTPHTVASVFFHLLMYPGGELNNSF